MILFCLSVSKIISLGRLQKKPTMAVVTPHKPIPVTDEDKKSEAMLRQKMANDLNESPQTQSPEFKDRHRNEHQRQLADLIFFIVGAFSVFIALYLAGRMTLFAASYLEYGSRAVENKITVEMNNGQYTFSTGDQVSSRGINRLTIFKYGLSLVLWYIIFMKLLASFLSKIVPISPLLYSKSSDFHRR